MFTSIFQSNQSCFCYQSFDLQSGRSPASALAAAPARSDCGCAVNFCQFAQSAAAPRTVTTLRRGSFPSSDFYKLHFLFFFFSASVDFYFGFRTRARAWGRLSSASSGFSSVLAGALRANSGNTLQWNIFLRDQTESVRGSSSVRTPRGAVPVPRAPRWPPRTPSGRRSGSRSDWSRCWRRTADTCCTRSTSSRSRPRPWASRWPLPSLHRRKHFTVHFYLKVLKFWQR